MLSRKEKFCWAKIVIFAISTSILEVATASLIVIFAQVLNEPEIGQRILMKIDFSVNTHNQVILLFAILVGLIYLIKNLMASFEIFFQNFSIQKMNYQFKNKLLNRYAKSDYVFYLTRNSSFGMQVVGGDAELMFTNGMMSLATMLSETIVFVGLVTTLMIMKPSLAIIVLGLGVILYIVATRKLLPHFYIWGKRLQEAGLQSWRNLLQFFHGFKEIVILGKQRFFVEAYQQFSLEKSRIQAMQASTNALPRIVIEIIFVGLFVLTITFLCLEKETPIQMMGILAGYLYTGFRLMPGLNRLISQLNLFKTAMPSIERVYQEYYTVPTKENYLDISDFSFEKGIQFQQVYYHYLNNPKNVLSNISLEIRKGDCIGIIGETGSGKSTLVDLILGLFRPTQGNILIDEKYPVNSLQWHKKVGYVPQAIYLIDDTIIANIAFGEDKVDVEKLNKAIDSAQLRAFIQQLPEKEKTIVGERGIRLSGGERQRIAIARALYRNPEVLIFDEATSALDNKTEERLMDTIHELSKERTVIMVAHRLSTLKDCNRIIQIQNGFLNEVHEDKGLCFS